MAWVEDCTNCRKPAGVFKGSECDNYHPDGDWYETYTFVCALCGHQWTRLTHCSEFASDEWFEGWRPASDFEAALQRVRTTAAST